VTLNLGGVIRLTYTVKNDLAVLVNPSTVTLTIVQPDGVSAPGITVVNPPTSTGVLTYDFTPTQVGLHQVHWATTGPVTAEDDVFSVEPALSLLISVDEAIGHLRGQGVLTSDSDRETLQWLCLAVRDAIEVDLSSAIVRRTVTETFDGGDYHLNLGVKPLRFSDGGAVSIVSVTESGSTVTDYTLRKRGWRLMRGSSSASCWAPGYENISVTYVPSTDGHGLRIARRVALNTVQLMWQSSQQAEHPFLDQFVSRTTIGSRTTIATSALASISQVEDAAYQALKTVNAR
jgi:hypothetical protein